MKDQHTQKVVQISPHKISPRGSNRDDGKVSPRKISPRGSKENETKLSPRKIAELNADQDGRVSPRKTSPRGNERSPRNEHQISPRKISIEPKEIIKERLFDQREKISPRAMEIENDYVSRKRELGQVTTFKGFCGFFVIKLRERLPVEFRY